MAEFFDILVRFVSEGSRIVYGPISDTRGPWLRLEQAPLEGVASGMKFGEWFAAKYANGGPEPSFADMMRYYEEWRSFCNEKAEFITEIWVHKSHPDLTYRLDASRGTWQNESPMVRTDEKTQTFSIQAESSQSLVGEAVVGVVCAQWEGNVYTETGERIIPRPKIYLIKPEGADNIYDSGDSGNSVVFIPDLSDEDPVLTNPMSGNITRRVTLPDGANVSVPLSDNTWSLAWGRKVIGTLKVVFVVEYDAWQLAISARTLTGDSVGGYVGEGGSSPADYDGSGYGVAICEEAYDETQPGTVYAATVYGVYAGGVETLEIETPPLEGNCDGGSGGSSSSDDDEPDREEEECYWHIIEVDPCTNEPTGKEWDEPAPCPGEDDENQGEPEEKEPTSYGPAKYWPSKYD